MLQLYQNVNLYCIINKSEVQSSPVSNNFERRQGMGPSKGAFGVP